MKLVRLVLCMEKEKGYLILCLAGIAVGDELVIDGGMATFEVVEKVGSDLRCKCTDPGLLLPRAKLTFWRDGKLAGKNSDLPTLTAKVNLILFSQDILCSNLYGLLNSI